MDPYHVPDDIWVEIFELLPRRQLAANVQQTCRRFCTLAVGPLLHHVLWITPAQIKEELMLWNTHKAALVMLPRSLCITPRLELDTGTRVWNSIPIPMLAPKNPLYEPIHNQFLLFTSLRTLTISNIVFCEDTYRVFQLISTLRSLRILNNKFRPLELSVEEHRARMYLPQVQLTALPITHLCLHNVQHYSDRLCFYHPLRLLLCPSLTSLALTWDSSTGQKYELHVHDPLSRNHLFLGPRDDPARFADSTHSRVSPNLTEIEVRIPLLQDEFFEGLVSLASPSLSRSALLPPLRVKIHLIKSILSDNRLLDFATPQTHQSNQASLTGVVPNVWSYTGPFSALNVFVAAKKSSKYSRNETPQMRVGEALENVSTPLTQLRLRPPGVSVSSIVEQLERLMRPLELEHLEVCVHSWDVEILFAIKELCPNVVRVVVRYGEGTMDEDHLIMLGSSILFGLKRLHTLRLLHDPTCAKDAIIRRRRPEFDYRALYGIDPSEPDLDDIVPAPPPENEIPIDEPVDIIPLEDFLACWDRYCPSLRRVQVGGSSKGIAWRRRWRGDTWHRMWVDDIADPEERGDSDYGWGDEGDDVDEGEIWSTVDDGSV